jgi:hypothetical protein
MPVSSDEVAGRAVRWMGKRTFVQREETFLAQGLNEDVHRAFLCTTSRPRNGILR